jgi:hypothetical protein
MARARSNAAESVGGMGKKLEECDQASADQQRLRNGRVADRVGIGISAVLDQVDFGNGRQPLQASSDLRQLQPRAEEAWSL